MRTEADTSQEISDEWKAAQANPRFIYGYGRYGDGKQWTKLDELTRGLQRYTLAVLAAPPKSGKSMLAAAWVPFIAEQADEVGEVVRIITLETSPQSYQKRMAALMAVDTEARNKQNRMFCGGGGRKTIHPASFFVNSPLQSAPTH